MTILILVFVSILLVIAIYGVRFSVLHITRFFTFIILGLMLINPVFHKTFTIKQKPIVAVDASQSMALSKKWENIQGILKKLKENGFRIYYLKDTSLTENVPAPNGRFTDLTIPMTRIQSPMLLISDGYHNAGSDLFESISLRRFPVYTVIPKAEIAKPEIKILNLELPGVVLEDEKPNLKVSTNLVPESAELFLDGQLIRKLTPKTSNFDVSLSPLSEGIHTVTLRIRGRGNEVTQMTKKIESISPKLNVQVLASRVSPLLGYLRRFFAPISRLEVWVKIKPNEWRLFGQREVRIGQPKKTRGLKILIDPTGDLMKESEDEALMVFLGKHGLSVHIEGIRIGSRPQSGYLMTKSNAENFPLLENIWPTTVRDSATSILESKLKGGGTTPLLYVIPARKMAICATTELWKIALVDPGFVDSIFENTLDILLASQVHFSISMKNSRYVVNEPITISSRMLDYRGRRIMGGWVRGLIENDTIFFVETGNGKFLSQPFTLSPGRHHVLIEYGQGQKTLGKKSIDVDVSTENIETIGTGVDTLTLNEIARRTGGRVFKENQIEILNKLIFTKSETRTVSPFRSLWSLFGLIIVLVFEWVVRQRKGLL